MHPKMWNKCVCFNIWHDTLLDEQKFVKYWYSTAVKSGYNFQHYVQDAKQPTSDPKAAYFQHDVLTALLWGVGEIAIMVSNKTLCRFFEDDIIISWPSQTEDLVNLDLGRYTHESSLNLPLLLLPAWFIGLVVGLREPGEGPAAPDNSIQHRHPLLSPHVRESKLSLAYSLV